MPKASRTHHADEFGKTGSSSISGLDAPMIGAGSAIILDGITERESGGTPPPPPVSVGAIALALAALLAVGLAILLLYPLLGQPPELPRALPVAAIDAVSTGATDTITGLISGFGTDSLSERSPVDYIEVDDNVPGGSGVGGGSPIFLMAYDAASTVLVNGRPYAEMAAQHPGLRLQDMIGWRGRFEYAEMTGGALPRLIRAELAPSRSQLGAVATTR
jgi:hypothetical protein